MPPKKQLKVESNQRGLAAFFELKSSSTTEKSDDTKDQNNNTSKAVSKPIIRSFNEKWFTTYSWLAYEKGDGLKTNYMYCTLCTENKKFNGMNKIAQNRNFQNSTLTRHASLAEHRLCVEAPVQRENLKQLSNKNDSVKDKAMKVLIKSMHWLCAENIPILKFKSFVEFLHELEVPDLAILKKSAFGYNSDFTASELLDAMAVVAENKLNDQLSHSPVVTVLTDESTDICNSKRLVLYAQLIQDMKPTTVYINNIECTDATGRGIARTVLDEMHKRHVSSGKIMSLGSDGASVMTGKHNGNFILKFINKLIFEILKKHVNFASYLMFNFLLKVKLSVPII